MTLEEKAAFCSGRDFWHTKAIERLGVPSVMMCDGPHGLRKQEGEGSEKMMQNMMLDMPLGSLVSYGRMTSKQLKGLIASLNA